MHEIHLIKTIWLKTRQHMQKLEIKNARNAKICAFLFFAVQQHTGRATVRGRRVVGEGSVPEGEEVAFEDVEDVVEGRLPDPVPVDDLVPRAGGRGGGPVKGGGEQGGIVFP